MLYGFESLIGDSDVEKVKRKWANFSTLKMGQQLNPSTRKLISTDCIGTAVLNLQAILINFFRSSLINRNDAEHLVN